MATDQKGAYTMNELTIIKSANFGDIQCDIYSNDDQLFMTREQIGSALGYSDPVRAIAKLHDRKKDRLDQFSVVVKLTTTDGKAYNTTVYTRKGIMEICRHSNQPKADAFMDWVWDVMDALMTGKVTAVPTADLRRMEAEARRMRAEAMLMNAQSRKIKTIMATIGDKHLSSIAIETFGLKAIETATGIDVGIHLPRTEMTYSATEVGKMYGISANMVGKLANRHGLKTDENGIVVMDKSPHSSKEMPNFRYNQRGVDAIGNVLGVAN